ncbi:hypothetical protein Maq22A_c00250 [Methylobacterium aquaticum]|uniref:Uncharacterized protein n=1 Tax=Methylobacterium aquaticum TaxID=270351 RepID=A0A0C6FET8_9HYPH|nr:hypothetical protein Maq22A_c00250 [Methylobacterium aquaticum]
MFERLADALTLADRHGGCEHEESERGGCGGLVIAGQPAAATNPAKGAHDHPASRLHRKARLSVLGLDDFDGDGRGRADPLTPVGAIGKAGARNGQN